MRAQAETGPAEKATADGGRALADGDLPAAERAYTAALESLSGHDNEDRPVAEAAAAAHLGLGRVCLARNHFRAADLRFDQVQRLSPDKPDGYYWAGCVAAHHASFDRAEWLFGAALDRDTRLGKAYLQRAFVRLKRQQDDLALADLLAAAGHDCVDDNARLLTAALLVRQGAWSRAESFAAEIGPGRPEAAMILGVVRHRQGDLSAALAEYERAKAGGYRDLPQAMADDARRKLALTHHDTALAAAGQRDWSTAASLLHSRDNVMPTEPDLIDALIHILGGDRATATDLLGRIVLREPANHRIAHAQAVSHLHAVSAGNTPANASWQECVSAWVSVLHSKEFSTEWLQRAQRRYGRAVPETMVDSVRTALVEFIEDRLPAKEMSLLLRRELDAARSLAQLGGLPVGEPSGPRLVCGPLRITETRTHRHLSEFLTSVAQSGVDVDNARRQFSHLGLAQVHLAAGRPREAARVALDLRCPSCVRATGPSATTRITDPLLCEPGCGEFDLRNPAFCALPDKRDQLTRLSGALAVDTLLGIARSDIASSDMDLADAKRHWRAAITLAAGFGRRGDVLTAAVTDALGRAKALRDKKDVAAAIAVLDAVLIVIPANDTAERDRVTPTLAELLTTRSMTLFKDDHTGGEAGRADLNRAARLNPGLKPARLNLGVSTRAMAYDALDAGQTARGIELLREAITHFERGLEAMPDDPQFGGELAGTRADLAKALGGGWPKRW